MKARSSFFVVSILVLPLVSTAPTRLASVARAGAESRAAVSVTPATVPGPFVAEVSPTWIAGDAISPSTASLVLRGLGLAGATRIALESADGSRVVEASTIRAQGDSLARASVFLPAGLSGEMSVVVTTRRGEDRLEGWLRVTTRADARSLASPMSPAGPASSLQVSKRQDVWHIAVAAPPLSQAPQAAIFDVQGRRLATLSLAPDGTAWTATWTEHTDSGARVIPGLYFLRIGVGREVLVARLRTGL